MMLKLLGGIDLIVALLLALAGLGMDVNRYYIIFAIMHAVKAAVFCKNVLSIIDLLIAAYTFIFPFWNNSILTVFCVVFLGVKGLYSMV